MRINNSLWASLWRIHGEGVVSLEINFWRIKRRSFERWALGVPRLLQHVLHFLQVKIQIHGWKSKEFQKSDTIVINMQSNKTFVKGTT